MKEKTGENVSSRVELVVLNKPGVLGRVVGHIRREGWNIKRLAVDEAQEGSSVMEIDIEGTHTKLAQVMERILNLDCVISISMVINGEKVIHRRPKVQIKSAVVEIQETKTPPKKAGAFRVLAVNPGSTSTKFALYDDEVCIFSETIQHDAEQLAKCGTVLDQKKFRRDCVTQILTAAQLDFSSLDAVAGRGGLLKPIESGVYEINEKMLDDLHSATAAIHASALGAIIASEIAAPLGIGAYVVDPVVVDEMDRNAKLTGMPGVERSSVFHALNQKAIARRLSAQLGKPYENARLIVAHLGGGITVGAHRYGRVIDVNDALAGEGPFTP
jgi:acetolactate synthase small subunit